MLSLVSTAITFHICISLVDILWIYLSYPPFNVVLDTFEIINLHCYITFRAIVLFVIHFYLARIYFSNAYFFHSVKVFGYGILVNMLSIILFGAYIFSETLNNITLAILLASEWWLLIVLYENTNYQKSNIVLVRERNYFVLL